MYMHTYTVYSSILSVFRYEFLKLLSGGGDVHLQEGGGDKCVLTGHHDHYIRVTCICIHRLYTYIIYISYALCYAVDITLCI